MNHLTGLALAAAVPLFVVGCSNNDDDGSPPAPAVATASDVDGDVARQWLDLVYEVVRAESLSPPIASRAYGYAWVAFYEAVVDGIPDRRSVGGQLNGLAALPGATAGVHDWKLAANAAMGRFLADFFATGSQGSLDDIAALEADLHAMLSASLPQAVVDRSVAHGETVADSISAWRATDDFNLHNNCGYVVPVPGGGAWEPTPPDFAAPLQPCWGAMRCFALVDGTDCAPLGPPAFETDPLSQFYSQALEVYAVTANLTPEQLAIADFWADGPGSTGTPAGHWLRILSQISAQEDLSLAITAEAFAKIGIGMADAFISCWNNKYLVNLLRPVTYIQAEIDPTWTSPIGTPPFPEYTSGHSTQSGAASWLLQDLLGLVAFTDDTHAGVHPARTFDSFYEAADEAAISRLYGGIHFRAAIEHGVEQGRCIGQTLLATVDFEE